MCIRDRLEPDQASLGDLAVSTATQDYFYVEGTGGNGSFRIKNLNKMCIRDSL